MVNLSFNIVSCFELYIWVQWLTCKILNWNYINVCVCVCVWYRLCKITVVDLYLEIQYAGMP